MIRAESGFQMTVQSHCDKLHQYDDKLGTLRTPVVNVFLVCSALSPEAMHCPHVQPPPYM